MKEITINILDADGNQSGAMTINFETAFNNWGIRNFKAFVKLAKVSDEMTDTNSITELTELLDSTAKKFYEFYMNTLEKSAKKDAEKAEKFLNAVSPEKYAEFQSWKEEQERKTTKPETTEEPEPITEIKEESTMNENTTNTAVQAETWEQFAKNPENYSDEITTTKSGATVRMITQPDIIHHVYTNENQTATTAHFVEGASYLIGAKHMKSAGCNLAFTVDKHTGKSLTITVFEKYNGTITETTYKNKKLNPGSHGLFESTIDGVKYSSIDTINIDKISRWTSGIISPFDCLPVDIETFKANAGTSTTAGIKEKSKPEKLDFSPVYYPVSEELARLHKEMISFDDYKENSCTNEYRKAVAEAFEMARVSDDPEKSLYLANVYAKNLARWYDDINRNGASCPSVMICGAGNFPTKKKERQNARHDVLMQQFQKLESLKRKIKHPHGWNQEIVRDTITAEEFENVLYFKVVINQEINRLQLVDFEDFPTEEQRSILKSHGFRFSKRFTAWQRQLTENAVCDTWKIISEFDALEIKEIESIEIPAHAEPAEENAESEPIAEAQAEQETKQDAFSWDSVKFESIDDLPNPETFAETEHRNTIEIEVETLQKMLHKLDAMKNRLQKLTYADPIKSSYYGGMCKALEFIITNDFKSLSYILKYDSDKKIHCFGNITAEHAEADTSPTEAHTTPQPERLHSNQQNSPQKPIQTKSDALKLVKSMAQRQSVTAIVCILLKLSSGQITLYG